MPLAGAVLKPSAPLAGHADCRRPQPGRRPRRWCRPARPRRSVLGRGQRGAGAMADVTRLV